MLLAEQSKERGRLQRGVPAELGRDPGPVLLKGVRSRQVAARLLELVGQFPQPLVPAHCLHAHSCLCSRLFLGSSLGTFAFHQKYLRVALHGASSFWHHVMATRRGSTQQVILIVAAGKSNCRSSPSLMSIPYPSTNPPTHFGTESERLATTLVGLHFVAFVILLLHKAAPLLTGSS